MRKLLLAVAVLSIVLFACKKDKAPTDTPNPPANNGERFPVSFSVTGFLQKLEQLPNPSGREAGNNGNLRDSALAGKVSHLYYLLYNESGQYVKGIHQSADDADFGSLVDTLPANRYTITLIAATDPVEIVDTSFYYGLRIRMPDAPYPMNVSAPDIFVGGAYFTVTGYGPAQTVAIWPNRIVGRVEVNILDAPEASWPGDSSVLIYTSPAYRSINYINGYVDEQIPDPGIVLKRNSRTNFSTQLLSPNSELTVTIVYPDKITGERKVKEMRYVPFSRGYRTVMSGNIYNPLGGGTGFAISLDTTWYNYANVPF
ncbi:hypothetical protein [Chitinophaga pinensis]|uniref:Uncharacterized protein n=1 Tax=Chitinophaga pinensis (strain ATCC 43595 / DSM 2588 / LMG 13176 / NBRC 15968 / NCIMB 11800 / UQM 2034) TaxID=485918 RepID=A0A979G382_CHIPD|nr:hypothetical protein [Chitinophaga pinensis]ACU59966.1 hypothetical protein Cpin_2478 [Chitinophaga pinensis DSM 2588]